MKILFALSIRCAELITGADNRSFVQQVHAHMKSLIALTHGLGVGILAS